MNSQPRKHEMALKLLPVATITTVVKHVGLNRKQRRASKTQLAYLMHKRTAEFECDLDQQFLHPIRGS